MDAHLKVGHKAILRKIEKILPELEEHPITGTGKPEAWMWYHKVVGQGRCPIVDTWFKSRALESYAYRYRLRNDDRRTD